MIKVTIVCESLKLGNQPRACEVYPEGLECALQSAIDTCAEFIVRTVSFDRPEFDTEWLDDTDVLIWWDHLLSEEISRLITDRIRDKVCQGMGLIILHSAIYSRVFTAFTGLNSYGRYRESGERERMWIIDRSHPIVEGLPETFVIEHTEVYGEPMNIPAPDELIAISWFPGGEVMRSAFTLRRGAGRIFVLAPGHEEFPIYRQEEILTMIKNACRWAFAPNRPVNTLGETAPIEPQINS